MTSLWKLGLAVGTVGFILGQASTSQATVWTEIVDAGDLPASAQLTGGGGALTAITGSLTPRGDADLYQIYITGGGSFSATTVGGVSFDSQLFLFDASGHGIYANDDTPPGSGSAPSLLPAFHPLTPVTPGLYYLLITAWNLAPASGGSRMFPNGVGTSDIPVGPFSPSDVFDSYTPTGSCCSGPYTIFLTGASPAVPEPGTLLLLAAGLLGLTLRTASKKG